MNVFIDLDDIRTQLMDELRAELKEEVVKELQAQARRSKSQHPGYVTAAEAAEILRCSVRRIYRLVELGHLTAVKDGRRLLVHEDAISRHLGEAA